MAPMERLTTASQLLPLILTAPLGTTTAISFGLPRVGLARACRPVAKLTMDYPSTDTWGSASQPIAAASWLTVKEGSSEACLSIPELLSLPGLFVGREPRFGSALLVPISDWIISTLIHGTGFDEIEFSMMPSFGANTNTVIWSRPSELAEWLRCWMISHNWLDKLNQWVLDGYTSGISPTTGMQAWPSTES
jgi:hypothetical protein